MISPSPTQTAPTSGARPQPTALALGNPQHTEPIRAELYGLEALEAQARDLAASSPVAPPGQTAGPLLQRLEDNGRTLVQAYRRIVAAAGRGEPLTSDAEWLLDNFYIVEEVLRSARHDLPRSYYRELPKLADGPLAGYPRVFSLALALIAYTDSSLDEEHITRFAQAYQTVEPLNIGEVWAVPTMLRLGLIENLRRLSGQMITTWEERQRAEAWLAEFTADANRPAPALPADARPTDTFIVWALRVLREQGPPAAYEGLKNHLTERGIDAAEVVRRENQRQAVNQVSVGNCVTSLRLLGALDWAKFFEATNLTEPILREDPAGLYAQQDFATRDRYRQAVERLARGARHPEQAVARQAVARARQAPADASPRNHVGYYLTGPGLAAFKAELGYRPPLGARLRDFLLDHPHACYFGALAAVTGFLTAAVVVPAAYATDLAWPVVLAILAALVPAAELAVGVVNWLVTQVVPPRTLPKLDFRDGIPADCATFVVMPSMLARPESAAALTEKLEIHYLANPDPQLRFALLTDFADSATESLPEDEGYLHSAKEAIAELNRKYAGDGPPRFFLFHRGRRWNAAQGCWMGWERKRGKLAEFNRLLRGDRGTSYGYCSTDPATLPHTRFVITLDVDTQLPRDAARRLIGTLAHPLNRPRFDPARGRVVEGYGLLQPRIGFHVTAAHRSRFTRIWATSAGIDPYSTAVSDVYQDLFGAGTFTGKGIYDLDAFEAATGATFPENHILSHDLIEGNYVRCGLVTEIELYDDFPVRYHAYARREHRWIRGDWQLLPWLFGSAERGARNGERSEPGNGTGSALRAPRSALRVPNLPFLERWKIFDNLRRSLTPPGLVLWVILGWTVLPLAPWAVGAVALLALMLPLWLQTSGALLGCLRTRTLTPIRQYLADVPATAAQVGLSTAFLLYQAGQCLDAIGRTVFRLYVSRRFLLEWETSSAAERRLGNGLEQFWRLMWSAPVAAVALAMAVALWNFAALPAAAPFLVAWLASPWLAWWVSQPRPVVEPPLTAADRRDLRRTARKTWGFFETFVGPEDHWLPPDNFQEEPRPQVAHRTSPTNQGLLLLSTLAAHDFGYLSLGGLLGRLEKTLATFERMERYHGHFYNWYETQSLRPLEPRYLSTVDSGNLLACLVTLTEGLHEKPATALPAAGLAEGLRDTLGVLGDVLGETATAEELPEFRGHLADLERLLATEPQDLPGRLAWLESLAGPAEALLSRARRLADRGDGAAVWAQRLADQVKDITAELLAVAPWLPLLADREGTAAKAALVQVGSLVRWEQVRQRLVHPFAPATFAENHEALLADLNELGRHPDLAPEHVAWLGRLAAAVTASTAGALTSRCQKLAGRAQALAAAMDFKFLYKPDRHLFAIGYNVAHGRLDGACYDLLASEARLASFLAIARGDVPGKHWFHLGRLVTRVGDRFCLLSWSGTMFEYLMPELLLRRFPGTLLAESCVAAVDRQIAYGRQCAVPWGISESAFSSQFVNQDYQYQAFGVPGLGLKRGLAHDLVIAPYATMLATMVHPHAARDNLRRLAAEGGTGAYGFYESLDFTRKRIPEGRRALVVRCFMAHHQGMGLVALANTLLGGPMPRRFHAAPMVRATELLLQERVPTAAEPSALPDHEAVPRPAGQDGDGAVSRRLTTPFTPLPRTHLVSNGRYTVMLTNSGAGFSRCDGLDVTRWREDATKDDAGTFLYVRDLTAGGFWSAGYQPVRKPADHYEVIYSADKAEILREDGRIATHLEVTVCPENTAEVRRVTLTNHDDRPHDLELTSYAEVVLGPHAADLAHPAFGKLFLETEWVPAHAALLCRRRPRAPGQEPIWAVHVCSGGEQGPAGPQYETDRARFLGRGRSPAAPAALAPGGMLSNTTGPVLDPVFSLRRRAHVEPGASVTLTFCTAMARTRSEALALADHYHDPQAAARVFDLAWAHSQIELRHLRITTEEAHLYQRLASNLIYAGPALRAAPQALAANRQGQPGLWRYGISGDRPILLVRVSEAEEVPLVRQLLAAHAFWRLKGLEVDLVILTEQPTSYYEELYQQLQEAIRAGDAQQLADKPGGVFLRKSDLLPPEDKVLLQAVARVVLDGRRGALVAQVGRTEPAPQLPEPLDLRRKPERRRAAPLPPIRLPDGLLFANGVGGFTPDGREYCILPYQLADGGVRPALPPAPWVNVIANAGCGCLVSEAGLGATWVFNSQQYRLTPWSNDPVTDPPGEAIYLRDETTGEVWSPTPGPLGADAATLVRHGQGYTTFEQNRQGLAQTLTVFVPAEDPVKILLLKVRNAGERHRQLSATYFAEWVLGSDRDRAPLTVRTEVDPEEGVLLAFNPWGMDYGSKVAFADVGQRPRTLTGDRTAFLGRNSAAETPVALSRAELSGRAGAGLDPCAALQAPFVLAPGEEKEIVFLIGATDAVPAARKLAARYKEPGRAAAALKEVRDQWERILTAVQVQTPDKALDLLLNRWLVYQVLACRVWGRTAFYQSGGAYGFRDQLQDGMALVYGAPAEARAHLLRAAAHQFVEGDVQHWWHPPAGRGVRTRFSDDFLWLPFAVCHYVAVTGDAAVLDEPAPFLRAPRLKPGQEDEYGLPEVADETGTLYEHCVRALKNGLKLGSHGLPLMGAGDWNDGMNRVGLEGKGETVWGGWFLLTCLRRFAEFAEARGQGGFAAACRNEAEQLREAIETNAWDGRWYRRAYFDDGTPLGSAQNDECQIDSLVQTWGVISGAAEPERARQAMAEVEARLVKPDDGLILLFTPPFDKGRLQPGYIKGYVPGIRENGGQYTHAAAWVVQATALLGQGTRAGELFDLLNPIRHTSTPERVAHYRVEPYVVAGDVYGQKPHTGRGGWTWYTGSAAWLYRVAVETMLGLEVRGDRLRLNPVIPKDWPGFDLMYRHRSALYRIHVENLDGAESGVRGLWLDGQRQDGAEVRLADDGKEHAVRVVLGVGG